MRRRLGGRGLVFDPLDRFRIRSLPQTLKEVGSPSDILREDNVFLMLDRGGELVDQHPVIDIGPAGGADFPVRYRTAPKFVASVRNAAVIGEGLVLTEDGEFIEEIHPPCRPAKYGAHRLGDELTFDAGPYGDGVMPIKYFDTPALLMEGPTDTAFGDWILNFAPRLGLAEAAGLNCPILLRWNPQHQSLPILEALGVSRDRIILHERGTVALFPKLYVTSWPSRDKTAPMSGVFDIFARARRPRSEQRPLVYLTRSRVVARPLLNEAEVCALFARRGFQIVSPGELSFEQVQDLFSNPACVAGPFGSAFLNLVFGSANPIGLALMPAHLPIHLEEMAFWQAQCGNRFAYVPGEIPAEVDSYWTPWTISLERVEQALDHVMKLLAESGGPASGSPARSAGV